MTKAQLSVRNLSVTYWPHTRALTDIDIEINSGQVLGIVGESGCGKSTLASALVGDIPNARAITGQVLLHGKQGTVDLVSASYRELAELWGRRISMVYQDPARSLNPAYTVGDQVDEAVARRPDLVETTVRDRTLQLFEMVHLPLPKTIVQRYPHQLSGGQQQRVVIAMALAASPDLLLMDEPTTGLDVTTESRILDLIQELKADVNAAIVYITHNLAVVARVADRIAVMYAGEFCELGDVQEVFEQPLAPYTKGLFSCVPSVAMERARHKRLAPIPGTVSSLDDLDMGCRFAERCPFARDFCQDKEPELVRVGKTEHAARCLRIEEVGEQDWPDTEKVLQPVLTSEDRGKRVVLEAKNLGKTYGHDRRRFVWAGPIVSRASEAVKDVSFKIYQGETLGIVGESGCGKTTILGNLCGLIAPSKGEIWLDGELLNPELKNRSTEELKSIQMVFQNPDKSLNPQHSIRRIIGRAMKVLNPEPDKAKQQAEIIELLKRVGLDESYLERRPSQLSGGEKQRVAIARALIGEPAVILADEVTSALDVSVRASTLNLLQEIQEHIGVSFVFVSHDMSAIRYLADRVLVLYLGMVMEEGPADTVFNPPFHPYSEALISAIPVPDPRKNKPAIQLEGSVPSATDRPKGCPFQTRCPRKIGEICEKETPPYREGKDGHRVFCHWPLDELRAMQNEVHQ